MTRSKREYLEGAEKLRIEDLLTEHPRLTIPRLGHNA